jgi:Arc/MetJ family transcription regulator
MTVTSIDIDPDDLSAARDLVGASSNRETVDIALKTLIAVRRQASVVERLIARRFDDDQIDAGTIDPDLARRAG